MSVLETLVGFVAPPDCLACGAEGTCLCHDCSTLYIKPFGERCWRCNRLSPASRNCSSCRHIGGPAHVFICTTYEGIAQKLVQLYKFGHARPAVKPLADIMASTFSPEPSDYLIVPVPTATVRARQRGFDHSELLAKQISHRLKLQYKPALRRLGQSRQLGSAREQRLKQLEGNFVVRTPNLINGQKILLIDDVLTTGGTLISAARILRAAGASQVDAMVFAKRL